MPVVGIVCISSVEKMREQLEAVWNSKSGDQPTVKGFLLTNLDCSAVAPRNEFVEKWFVLVGHSLFYCKSSDSQEYSGVFLTDVFNPVIAGVSQKVLDAFQLPGPEQV
jgi:hypothetical protein